MPIEVLLCRDVNCSNFTHFQHLNKYAIEITNACPSAAEEAIPLTFGHGESGLIQVGRNMRSLFVIILFSGTDCGTSTACHYAVRKVRKDEDRIISERTADVMANNCECNFWAETKRIRSPIHRPPT